MNDLLSQFIFFLESYAANHAGCSKEEIASASKDNWNLTERGPVFHRPEFAVRFSIASGNTFSNGIISLSTLKRYDHQPFIVCIVRPNGIELLLANTTFLKKISHSSHQLRVDNVRGTFLGHDIIRTYAGVSNTPENFLSLFEIHTECSWEDNLIRLVESTNAIVPTGVWFDPSVREQQAILEAPRIAERLSSHSEYIALGEELTAIVHTNRQAIITIGQIDNVNLRGNRIEQIITQAGSFHSLEDFSRKLTIGTEVQIDIKTKIVTLQSSPKGYNIDKVLRVLGQGDVVFAFFFIGIDTQAARILTCLVSIFDKTLLNMTRINFHWAGRNSRGVTQLSGNLNMLFEPEFAEEIDVEKAQTFLAGLIDISPTYVANHGID